jgi:hypothetical protein
MTGRSCLAGLAVAALLAGCASTPPTVVLTPEEQYEPELVTVPPITPLVEYPPIEPVEPPPPEPAPPSTPSAPAPTAAPPEMPPAEPVREPPSADVAPASVPSAEPTDDQQLIALLGDLQRYGVLSPDDLRRELGNATAALARQRTDANRIRLAVLYTLIRATPQDDQRALQLFDNVAKNNPGSAPFKQLAGVLSMQVTERQKAVHDEQQKADAAINKLEALRQMERSLLRDRVRSGGGGGGGGGGGSGH